MKLDWTKQSDYTHVARWRGLRATVTAFGAVSRAQVALDSKDAYGPLWDVFWQRDYSNLFTAKRGAERALEVIAKATAKSDHDVDALT